MGARSSSGPDAVEYAAAHGLLLDEWQDDFLFDAMGELSSGQWAALVAAIIAARRNGKNFGVYARELYGLGILAESVIHTAQLFKTTKESYNDLLSFIQAGPLGELLTHNVASPGTGYTMWFSNGGRIDFIARSATSGRGLNSDLLVLDEAQDLNDDHLAALVPTQAARPNPQVVYLGSAPAPEEKAMVWQRVRRRGREGLDPRMVFYEFSASPDADLDNREAWRQANPGLVTGRLNIEVVESERSQLSDEMFARERLSISPDIEDFSDRPFSMDAWHAVGDPDSQIARRVVLAVDVSPAGTEVAIATAGIRDDGIDHVEVACHGLPPSDAVRKLIALVKEYGGPVVLDPTGPAVFLVASLTKAGVEVRATKSQEMTAACSGFANAVREKTLRHIDQRVLTAAVKDAATRPLGDGGWAWGRKSSTVDISPLVAVTLARWALAGVPSSESGYDETGMVVLG